MAGDADQWRGGEILHRGCPPYDKFKAWAATVPQTLRNPLYHWTHLELKRYFGIADLLDEKTPAKSGNWPTKNWPRRNCPPRAF